MPKQLLLFPELTTRVVNNLDDCAERYSADEALQEAYKAGASKVLGDIIDLLKSYTDLHES